MTTIDGAIGLPAAARRRRVPAPRAVVHALMGALALFGVYTAIVAGASQSLDHYLDQMRADSYFIVPLMAGFGTQVALFTELRRRKRLHALAAGAGVGGATSSTVGMVACCAHHIVDLAPFLGASAAATFLTTWKVPLILVGLAVNAAGIAVGLRSLRSVTSH
jgi:hypothetical protein